MVAALDAGPGGVNPVAPDNGPVILLFVAFLVAAYVATIVVEWRRRRRH